MVNYSCPSCGAVLKDWRRFSEKSEVDKVKPFECTSFRCGKRWKYEEILQSGAIEEGRKEE
ncbi:MAG: hypothetical protein PUJ00_10495 [Actinobacillus minor]|nr:hypothetical protein [Actinobacillus minor]